MALLGVSSLLLHHHPPTALQFPCTSISATITTQGTSPSSSSSSSSSSSRGSRQQRESLPRRNELKPKEELQARSSEQLLQFEREGHSCVRNLFDATEMASLEATVSAAAARERLNSYRHRVAVLCPGVDPFSLHSVSEAESVIRKKVPFFNHHKPRNAYVYNWFDYVKLHHWMCAYQAQGCTYNLLFLYVYSCENWKVEYMRCINLNKESAECWVSSEKILNPEGCLHLESFLVLCLWRISLWMCERVANLGILYLSQTSKFINSDLTLLQWHHWVYAYQKLGLQF